MKIELSPIDECTNPFGSIANLIIPVCLEALREDQICTIKGKEIIELMLQEPDKYQPWLDYITKRS